MAKLMRTAFLIGLAVTWRPDAAAGQYSWSTYSVSAGIGTGGFGVGASYTAVDPWYDSYYADPCWDYAYYELYWYECPVGLHRYASRQSYYRPYGYYGYPNRYPSHSHFSIGLSVNFGFGYRTGYYGYQPVYYGYNRYRPYYPTYGYPVYGYPIYGSPVYGYPVYGYPEYGVVRYGGRRTASVAIPRSLAYRASPLLPSSPQYKESPQQGRQRTATARSITSGTTADTRSVSGVRARASSGQRSTRVQTPVSQRRTTRVAAPTRSRSAGDNSDRGSSASPTPTNGTRASRAQTPRPTSRVTAQRATRVRRTDAVQRVVPSTRRGESSNGTQRSARAPAARSDRSSRAPANATSRAPAPPTAAPSPTTRSRSGVVRRSAPARERAPVTRSAPSARSRTTSPSRARTASPSRSRAIQPSARRAPTRTQTRAPAARSAAPRATTSRSRASSGGASRAAPRARTTAPARSRSPRRSGR